MWLELRTLCLLGRHSTICVKPPSSFFLPQTGSHIFAQEMPLEGDPPKYASHAAGITAVLYHTQPSKKEAV
jgi:hypothetical protein